jgi:hypothetical protein
LPKRVARRLHGLKGWTNPISEGEVGFLFYTKKGFHCIGSTEAKFGEKNIAEKPDPREILGLEERARVTYK